MSVLIQEGHGSDLSSQNLSKTLKMHHKRTCFCELSNAKVFQINGKMQAIMTIASGFQRFKNALVFHGL